MSSNDKHIFACFTPHLSRFVSATSAKGVAFIHDKELAQRITAILRIKSGERLILFDMHHVAQGTIEDVDRRSGVVHFAIDTVTAVTSLKPALTLYVASIKKEALESVAYYATQMGVRDVYLVDTEKSTPIRGGWEKIHERLQRIAIAAAEQSKQFCFPRFHAPQLFANVLHNVHDHTALVLSPDGDSLADVLTNVQQKKESYSVWCGPEGGFTDAEHDALARASMRFVRLTPSILRTQEAVLVSLGALRSVLS